MYGTSFFGLLAARERWLGARYTVVAENVANADTPGYRPRDLVPSSFGRLVEALSPPPAGAGLVRTDPRHLPAASPPPDVRVGEGEVLETTPSGNAVILSEEVQKLAAIEKDYRLTLQLFRKYKAMFETALRLEA